MAEARRKAILSVLKVVNIRKDDTNKESGTELVGTDREGIQALASIKRKVLRGEILGAIEYIQSSKPLAFKFGKMTSQLAQQIMIELIRDREIESALEFGQKIFSDYAGSREDIEKIYSLLAFEDCSKCPHAAELLGASQRLKTANVVTQSILTSEGQEGELKLYNMLREWLMVQMNEINEMAACPQINISSGILEDPVI